MSRNELIAKIETLRNLEALIEEAKREAETIRDSIKAEMEAVETEELSAGGYMCAGHLFSLLALIPSLSRRNSERKYIKPLLNKSHPAASPSAHEKSP